MRIALLVLLFLVGPAALGGPVASAATDDEHGSAVSIFAAAYGSTQVDVLAGDTVTWRNDSVRQHTVSAADGSWASPRLGVSAAFSHRFEATGSTAYYCQLHPFMRGEVDVHRVMLAAPRDPAAPGRPFVLSGRAALPAGSTVSIQPEGAQHSQAGATATVDSSGAFSATVKPAATTSFRAAAGDEVSPPVQVLVLDRKVVATARARGRRVTVDASVRPASPGATVVLQLHLRERFGWWPVRRVRVDRHSRARFTVDARHPVRARVLLTASDGATELARSATLHLRPQR